MTQYKDKLSAYREGVKDGNREYISNANLLNYPILMAADILLYDTNIVPIGEDQKQHLELTRDIVDRFNHHHPATFVKPEVKLANNKKVFSLADPLKKMSKSDPNQKSYITLTDSPEQVNAKIKVAITDNFNKVTYDRELQPGISNLMMIYSELSNLSLPEIEAKYNNVNYGVFKADLADTINNFLQPLQTAYNNISNKAIIDILDDGAKRANEIASKKILEVQTKIGLRG